jgi:hypothetical protein
MNHPFSEHLGDLSSEELDQKYGQLLGRFNIARRMSMPPDILFQLDLLLSSIEEEKMRRAMVDDRANGVILDTDPLDLTDKITK